MTGYKQEVKTYYSGGSDTERLPDYCTRLIKEGYRIDCMSSENNSSYVTIIVTKETQFRNPLEDVEVYTDINKRTVIATKDGPKASQG